MLGNPIPTGEACSRQHLQRLVTTIIYTISTIIFTISLIILERSALNKGASALDSFIVVKITNMLWNIMVEIAFRGQKIMVEIAEIMVVTNWLHHLWR